MWKDIIGFESRYQIDENGIVRNSSNMNVLSSGYDRDGYLQIGLRKLGERKKYWFKIHRLVAMAFIDNPENIECLQIDHIDRNKGNNHYTNLRWVTSQENCNNRKNTAWKTNITTGELHITKYNNGFMIRINKHDLKHVSWHKSIEESILMRDSVLK